MTPGARIAAAIEILDVMSEGVPAEQALTRWARRSRFAGSKDRTAIRDHVFDVLRNRRTAAHYGQGSSGRALLIGQIYAAGMDHATLFTGQGHAPAPLTDAERQFPAPAQDRAVRWNLPDWLITPFLEALKDRAEATAMALQSRAPVCLRVNLARASRQEVQEELEEQGVETTPNPLAETALTVISGARKIRNTPCYTEGRVELQDAASQSVVEMLPQGMRVLDYCAGGGGKALAIAAQPERNVFAHDADARRMIDIAPRAKRAGTTITVLEPGQISRSDPFDVVLCDAPCSGSGAWRRSPEGKWQLTKERLEELTRLQDQILADAARLVRPGGTLAYSTCSILKSENEDRVSAFLADHEGWRCVTSRRFEVSDLADGFFTAHLTRSV